MNEVTECVSGKIFLAFMKVVYFLNVVKFTF